MKPMNLKRKRRTRNQLITVITILVLCACLAAFLYFFQKPIVLLSPNTRFPVRETVFLHDLVPEVKYGTLVTEDLSFDSPTAGTQQITFLVRDRLGILREQTLVIEFYDNIPPTISAPEEITVLAGDSIDLTERATATDDTGTPCSVFVSGSYDSTTPGQYPLVFTSSDSSGNTAKKEFTLVVLALPFDENGALIDGTYQTRNGFTLIVKDSVASIDGIVLANKSYSLPKAYPASGLTSETQKAFSKMQSAASKAGVYLSIKSSWRSWNEQNRLFSLYTAIDGKQLAMTYSAKPGHSEHQTGLAMDLVTASSEEAKLPSFAKPLAWLAENAYRYGFILRYPENKQEITGYIFEPWHYRYVGVELAEELYHGGDWITLEEYFGIDSVYRGE